MANDKTVSPDKIDEERREATRQFLKAVSKTFIQAEDYLELSRGTLADTNKDNSFLAVMKMSSTIEPLVNESLRAEIRRLRKWKAEQEEEIALADFVSKSPNRYGKAKLAKEMGLISVERLKFIEAIYRLRDHYAHNVKNFHLDLFSVIEKVEKEYPQTLFDLTGIEKTYKHRKMLFALSDNSFIYWRFAGFLSDALHVLKPPTFPYRGLLAPVLADKNVDQESQS